MTANNFSTARDRFSIPVPVYVQIAEGFLNRIESGELAPGDRLPPERELSELLSVNRMTVRRALRMLEGQGLLIRRQGAGTYVAKPKIERQASQLFPFTRGMEQRGYKPGIKLVSFEKRPAETSIAQKLGISVSSPVFRAYRLRTLNQEAVMLEDFTVPASIFPDFDRHDLSTRSLYEIFTKEYNLSISQAHQSLEPVIATEYEARLLGIDDGAPMMLERRLAFDEQGRPVEYSKDLYRGDRFRFITEIASLKL
jgi:GntR family transcriptional regulator